MLKEHLSTIHHLLLWPASESPLSLATIKVVHRPPLNNTWDKIRCLSYPHVSTTNRIEDDMWLKAMGHDPKTTSCKSDSTIGHLVPWQRVTNWKHNICFILTVFSVAGLQESCQSLYQLQSAKGKSLSLDDSPVVTRPHLRIWRLMPCSTSAVHWSFLSPARGFLFLGPTDMK